MTTSPKPDAIQWLRELEARNLWTVDASGCWHWSGSLKSNGYGQIMERGKNILAHRWVYARLIGLIPPGKVIDHLCNNPACVNPDHMQVVSQRENVLRGIGPTAVNNRKTHCKRGHPFDEANTWVRATGARQCRACHNERSMRQNRDRRKALAAIRAEMERQS